MKLIIERATKTCTVVEAMKEKTSKGVKSMLKKYRKLRHLIDDQYRTALDFAHALGVSRCWLSNRLCGTTPWGIQDAARVMGALGIPPAEMYYYFVEEVKA